MKRMLKSVQEIKLAFLQYHKKRGYRIFGSFPLVLDDPTVMFVNATITPFKHWFTDPAENPENYALIQRCFRMGGASELDSVGIDPYYHTFFEMFGSGIFNINHTEAIQYLLDLLITLNLDKERLYFTIPNDRKFKKGLEINGISKSRIFILETNGVFWQEWKFGKFGPVGKGLTVIYSHSDKEINSVNQMTTNPDRFIELLNLIYIYGQEAQDGKIVPVANSGFDLGGGIERFAATIQECNNYQIDSIKPFVKIITELFENQDYDLDEATARILTDHLRAICILIDEGLNPSNKKHGYVLKKLIRRSLELVWISANQIISIEIPTEKFCERLGLNVINTSNIIREEDEAFRGTIQRAEHILKKQPNIHPDVLWDTYGLSPKLARVLRKKERKNGQQRN